MAIGFGAWAPADEVNADLEPLLMKMPGGDQSITSVVAWATQQCDMACSGCQCAGQPRGAPASAFHQRWGPRPAHGQLPLAQLLLAAQGEGLIEG